MMNGEWDQEEDQWLEPPEEDDGWKQKATTPQEPTPRSEEGEAKESEVKRSCNLDDPEAFWEGEEPENRHQDQDPWLEPPEEFDGRQPTEKPRLKKWGKEWDPIYASRSPRL